jgi:hypothetical protein
MKIEFSRRIFDKSSNIKFRENPSKCSIRMEGRIGIGGEANTRFS